jgi:hypothetical protein
VFSTKMETPIAQLMGHTNVDMTLNVYTQVLDGSLREAVEKVGGELFTNRVGGHRGPQRKLLKVLGDSNPYLVLAPVFRAA